MDDFQFNAYPDNGKPTAPCQTTYRLYADKASARDAAGRMAIKVGGPVDLAHNDGRPWEERYITTASPSEHHAKGFRFERLES